MLSATALQRATAPGQSSPPAPPAAAESSRATGLRKGVLTANAARHSVRAPIPTHGEPAGDSLRAQYSSTAWFREDFRQTARLDTPNGGNRRPENDGCLKVGQFPKRCRGFVTHMAPGPLPTLPFAGGLQPIICCHFESLRIFQTMDVTAEEKGCYLHSSPRRSPATPVVRSSVT